MIQIQRMSSRLSKLFKASLVVGTIPVALVGAGVYEAKYYSTSSSELPKHDYNYNIGQLTKPSIKFYQYQVCPFCNKAKSVLSMSKIPFKTFDLIEVSPMSKVEIKFSDYKKVPIAVVTKENGETEQLNGSDSIIEYFMNENNIKESENGKKWRKWLNDDFSPLLPMVLHSTLFSAISAFDYITKQSSFTLGEKIAGKYLGALIMTIIANRMKRERKIENPQQELVKKIEEFTTVGLLELNNEEGVIAQQSVFGMVSVLDGNYEIWDFLKKADFEGKENFWNWYNNMKNLRDN